MPVANGVSTRTVRYIIPTGIVLAVACLSRVEAAPSSNLRLNWALSSETELSTAFWGDFEQSPEHNYLVGGSWGRTLNDRLFGWPVELTGNIGLQWLNERDVQDDGYGVNAYIKAHYSWRLPRTQKHVRFGLGEGLSYVSVIPMSEQRDFLRKGADVHSENLLNYLEWTVDVPLRDFEVFDRIISPKIDELYFGFFLFHRSSVFGLFAQTRGGSNYMGFGIEARY